MAGQATIGQHAGARSGSRRNEAGRTRAFDRGLAPRPATCWRADRAQALQTVQHLHQAGAAGAGAGTRSRVVREAVSGAVPRHPPARHTAAAKPVPRRVCHPALLICGRKLFLDQPCGEQRRVSKRGPSKKRCRPHGRAPDSQAAVQRGRSWRTAAAETRSRAPGTRRRCVDRRSPRVGAPWPWRPPYVESSSVAFAWGCVRGALGSALTPTLDLAPKGRPPEAPGGAAWPAAVEHRR